MKYVIALALFAFFIIGILNYAEIQKIRTKNLEKQALLKLMDTYMKLYWDLLPNYLKQLKKSSNENKKIIEEMLLERNHVYERMDITEKLIHHAKLEDNRKKLTVEKSKECKQMNLKLNEIEEQMQNLSKEYEKINADITKRKSNPFLAPILLFVKL